ncbi:MAG: RluA family pseudouridine synthase [bacterium]
MERLKVIYEDDNVLIIDKPAGLVVFPEGNFDGTEKTLIDYLTEEHPDLKNVNNPPRYGIVHRLDRETSGIILVAKNNESLAFLQKQFQEKKVIKAYTALVVGNLSDDQGIIKTLIGRSPKNRLKQRTYSLLKTGKGLREAITEYKVLQNFQNYALIEVDIKTGRKHQIRCHFNYLSHPIAGDKFYGFKNQPCPTGLKRQFLHASRMEITLPDNKNLKLVSELPEDLQEVLNKLKK